MMVLCIVLMLLIGILIISGGTLYLARRDKHPAWFFALLLIASLLCVPLAIQATPVLDFKAKVWPEILTERCCCEVKE